MEKQGESLEEMKRKNKNLEMIQFGLGMAGSIAGLIYAIKTKKSGWGKVGYWFLGGLIVGVPAGVTVYLINSKRTAEIEKLKSENKPKEESLKERLDRELKEQQ